MKESLMPRQMWTLTQADASFLIDHSINAARGLGVAVTVVIVEGGGNTVGLLRMDDAKLASIGVAEGKAWTAGCSSARVSTITHLPLLVAARMDC
jgi:uncharacterized protein GlcG (DUF336 family)